MAKSIVVNSEEQNNEENAMNRGPSRDEALVAWVMDHVDDWTEYRESNYKNNWEEYYRLWRGIWKSSDKTRDSERSKLIVPALQQAIESSVSELEEATFGKGLWFDVVDDMQDPEKEDVQFLRKQLHEDFELSKVPGAVSESFLNGALYGTGVAKILVEEVEKKRPASRPQEDGTTVGGVETYTEFQVSLEAVSPSDFCIDPAAKGVDDALGCAQTVVKPRHSIVEKQDSGLYLEGSLDGYDDNIDVSGLGESKDSNPEDKVLITEYAGLVPRGLLPVELEEDEEVVDIFEEESLEYDDTDLVEALVTIANKNVLLKATENPYMMQDRPFIAYQHDKVPNRFWGRGIAEKGFNPQKALDAELRARIDAMALSAHPMLAMDATRLPRGFRPTIAPGKTLLTNGNPKETLMPFQFPPISAATFTESGELERMIQMGTGSMDSATPVGISPRNATASGMSMMMSGAIKRSKRTLKNIELYFLRPLIEKAAWRYMQFAPERYPVKDYKFLPKTTIGIMAREYEQQQLTNLLGMVPQDSPMFALIMKGIFDNSSLESKDQMLKALEEHNQPQEPTPEEQQAQQQAQQLQQQMMQLELQEKQATIEEKQAKSQASVIKIETEKAKAETELFKAQMANQELELEKVKTRSDSILNESMAVKNEADAVLSTVKAETESTKTHADMYKVQLDELRLAKELILAESEKNERERNSYVSETIDEVVKSSETAKSQIESSLKQEIEGLKQELEEKATHTNTIVERQMPPMMTPNSTTDLSPIEDKISDLASMVQKLVEERNKPKKIVRDKHGRIVSVNGKKPRRNDQGLIEEI